ncbi:MAG: WD40 repeat domain-containing protein [Gemmataceae bacterium]
MIVLDGLDTGADRLEFAADGRSLLASSQGAPFRTVLWDLPSGGPPRLSWPGVREATFCPEGGRFVAIDALVLAHGEDSVRASGLRVIDPAAVTPAPPFDQGRERRYGPEPGGGFDDEDDFARHVRFTPDGTRLVAIGGDRRLRRWSWPALDPLDAPGPGGLSDPGALAFSPDGSRLGVFDRRGEVRLLDAAYLSCFWEMAIYSSGSRRPHLAFSPDGRLVAGASGSAMRVFDAASGARVAKVDFLPVFTGLAFTPDGRYLASSHLNGRVEFLDTSTWFDGPTFDWKIGGLRSLAFSEDGMLAAAGSARRVVVWDLDV